MFVGRFINFITFQTLLTALSMTKLQIDKIERITVSKRDEAAVVVEKIINSSVDEIVLGVPRFSKLVDSLANFHLIKREADLLKKKVIVESVDDKAIELAGLAKLESINPFFVKSRRQMSDIVIGQRTARTTSSVLEDSASPKSRAEKAKRVKVPKLFHWPSRPFFRRTMFFGALAVTILGLLFVMLRVLPRAEIVLVAKKSSWNLNDSVVADKNAAVIDAVKNIVPGQIFTQSRNLQLAFPASGKKKVENRASGRINIYNAYSSDPQPLVAQTRFLTPDGKIFRLVNKVTVPGAKIVDGKIVPSSIPADVVADQPGEKYNIGPVSRFTIPGLKGSPKYDSFYGESDSAMTGGFIGEVGYPAPGDIQKAEAELRAKLEDSLAAAVVMQIPPEFKILDGARSIVFSSPNLSTELDNAGNFGIFGEASMSIAAFKESDILSMLVQKAQAEKGPDFEVRSFNISYGVARTNFKRGSISFPVNFESVVARVMDTEGLKSKIAGKSEEDLKSVVFALPGLESARISLWPFWATKVPRNLDKISVKVE